MSQKPVCVKCACYYRVRKNGVWYVEMKPKEGRLSPRGHADPDKWEPYKLWQADLWECPECHHLIISGSGFRAAFEDYQPEFKPFLESLVIQGRLGVFVNDC